MPTQKTFQLIVSKVDGPLFDGSALSVTVPGVDGEMTILADHEAFISPLRGGNITVRPEEGESQVFPVTDGTLEVSDNRVTVLL